MSTFLHTPFQITAFLKERQRICSIVLAGGKHRKRNEYFEMKRRERKFHFAMCAIIMIMIIVIVCTRNRMERMEKASPETYWMNKWLHMKLYYTTQNACSTQAMNTYPPCYYDLWWWLSLSFLSFCFSLHIYKFYWIGMTRKECVKLSHSTTKAPEREVVDDDYSSLIQLFGVYIGTLLSFLVSGLFLYHGHHIIPS